MAGNSKRGEVPIPDLSWIKEYAEPVRPADAVTAQAFSDVWPNLGEEGIRKRLVKLVQEGKLEMGSFVENGKRRTFYWEKK